MPHQVSLERQMSAAPFDPVAGLFMAQGREPANLAAVLPGELSPLQRALLAIDGTVTTFLSAWALEPIEVQSLVQRASVLPVAALPSAGTWLEAPAGAPVLERAVMLVGGHSRKLYAWAESQICIERLPAALRTGLLSGGLSIGQLLLLPGFESRREGLWYGRERPMALPPPVSALTDADFLPRAYRVSAASQPLMLITERFPWALRQ